MEAFLFSAFVYLAAAVLAVPLAARLGLGSVLGYLMAGILIGPIFSIVGSETQQLQHFAEFGVVMMLFLIGLELEPRTLWSMRHRLLGLGGLQVSLTTAAITGCCLLFNIPWSVALAIGLAFALSSTAIVLQTLSEKNLMQTSGGRNAFAVLLTQDIAVIPMLAFLPLLALGTIDNNSTSQSDHGAEETPEMFLEALDFVDHLPGWGVALLTLGVVCGIILAGIYLTRPVFTYIHHTRLREMFTALALLIVVGIASLMLIVGLSPALGTFLAGVVLANSEFRHELESVLEPFKGLLLGLFFITVGAGIDFEVFFSSPFQLLLLALLVMVIKGAVLFVLAIAFKIEGRDRWLFTLGLAQAGEFGFVLVGFALQRNVIPSDISQQLYLIIALSMLLTPLFFILYEVLSKRMETESTGPDPVADDPHQQGPIIIAGIGRFGQVVNRMIQMSGFRATVLDNDLETVRLMRQFGFKSFLGDPTRPELLRAAGLETAKVLVVAMDDSKAALQLVRYARSERPDLHIIARAHNRMHVYELYHAGANDIVREMFDSSLRAGRYVLENMGLSNLESSQLERAFYKHDRETMLELAEVWQEGVPVAENEAYIARSKALNKDLEAALVTYFAEAENEAGPSPEPGAARTQPPPSKGDEQ